MAQFISEPVKRPHRLPLLTSLDDVPSTGIGDFADFSDAPTPMDRRVDTNLPIIRASPWPRRPIDFAAVKHGNLAEWGSSKDSPDYVSLDIGQSIVAALKEIGQPCVVKS